LNMRALATVWERPIIGGGLNNSSAVMKGTHDITTTSRGSEIKIQVVHNYYLIVLIDVGLVGFLLFFAFFGQAAIIGTRYARAAEPEFKILLVGMVAGLVGVAVHNLGDPFGAHQAVAMLWLYLGLIIAICRQVRAELPTPAQGFANTSALAPGPAAGSTR
jgi:O-antigen ligase